ncbi:MAG TPA: hypothetical protein VGK19_16505 [Capsulimonadaceae bacterium]|jgi:hypothetical protein
MNPTMKFVTAAVLAATTLASFAPSPAFAEKHDSNTLHKFGKAIEYPFRKAGENVSTGVHRASKSKSVETDRGKHIKQVVKPNGDRVYKEPTSGSHSKWAHKTKHHKHHIKHPAKHKM